MVAVLCEYTEIHFKSGTCTVYELYINTHIRVYTYILFKLSLFAWLKIKSKPKTSSKWYPIFNSSIYGHLDFLCRENTHPYFPFIRYLNCQKKQNLCIQRWESNLRKNWILYLKNQSCLQERKAHDPLLSCLFPGRTILLGLFLTYMLLRIYDLKKWDRKGEIEQILSLRFTLKDVFDFGPSFLNLQGTDTWTVVSDFMIIGISL